MTNTELIQAIKAEIERRIEHHDSLASNAESEMIANLEIGAAQALDDLLPFLSTLESERPEPYNPIYDEAYLNEKIKKATESWKGVDVDAMLAECRGYDEEESEKTVPADLEEAAVDIADALLAKPKDYVLSAKADYWNGAHDGIFAGAKWQKEQTEKRWFEDRDGCFWDGVEEGKKAMKEQMLKVAVEGFIFQAEDYYPKELIARYDGELKHGDKVRVIVCKKDDL